MKRNLIYYICPFNNNGEWRKNIQVLLRYFSIFNHRVIITIAQGKGLENAQEVKDMFAPKKVEFIEVENDPVLCEVKPFMEMLRKVQSVHPEEITFYAHGKGVFSGNQSYLLGNIQLWRNLMYHFCLNNSNEIDSILRNFSCCGCFKKVFPCKPHLPEPWHFSGSFFWFNHRALYCHPDWSKIRKNNRYAIEGYLATLFESASAHCLFDEQLSPKVNSPDLRTKKEWDQLLAPYGLNETSFKDAGLRTLSWKEVKVIRFWRWLRRHQYGAKLWIQ